AAILAWLHRRSRIAAVAAVLGGLAALSLPIIDMVRLHPYQYTHFNRASGGVRAAEGRYMLDYWGLSFKQAAAQLHATLAGQAPPQRWRAAVCGPQRPAQIELGRDFVVSWDPKGADFAMTL